MRVKRALVLGALLLTSVPAVSAQFAAPRYLSHAEAAAVFTALGESLPARGPRAGTRYVLHLPLAGDIAT